MVEIRIEVGGLFFINSDLADRSDYSNQIKFKLTDTHTDLTYIKIITEKIKMTYGVLGFWGFGVLGLRVS